VPLPQGSRVMSKAVATLRPGASAGSSSGLTWAVWPSIAALIALRSSSEPPCRNRSTTGAAAAFAVSTMPLRPATMTGPGNLSKVPPGAKSDRSPVLSTTRR